MSKAKTDKPPGKGKAPEPDSVTLDFDLLDLPTTHHKAGLAGLVMVIQAMEAEKKTHVPILRDEDLKPTSARVTFTAESMQGLFDYLYDAKTVQYRATKEQTYEVMNESLVHKPKKGKKSEKPDKVNAQPLARFLERHFSTKDGPWLRLWRDMLWGVPRVNPGTRNLFEHRAAGNPCKAGNESWQELVDYDANPSRQRAKNKSLTGALMLTAQTDSEESVPFLGQANHDLLLHFWQAVVMTYVPYELEDEEKAGAKKEKDKDKRKKPEFFILALPDVSDLRSFTKAFGAFLGQLPDKIHHHPTMRRKWRPAAAVVDVPAESGLAFLHHLSSLASDLMLSQGWAQSVSAVDSFTVSVERKGSRTVATLSGFARVKNSSRLIAEYAKIRGSFSNPMFRAALLDNLLADRPWHVGMVDLFAKRQSELFVVGEHTPRPMPRFGADARTKFHLINERYQSMGNDEDPKTAKRNRLSRIVWRLVREHLVRRTASRASLKIEDIGKRDYEARDGRKIEVRDYPKDFRDKAPSVCSEFFLTMRSRHDREFVDSFVGTVAASSQSLGFDDYRFLTSVLLRPSQKDVTGNAELCWEDVKAMAMLAASAHSHILGPKYDRKTTDAAPPTPVINEEA